MIQQTAQTAVVLTSFLPAVVFAARAVSVAFARPEPRVHDRHVKAVLDDTGLDVLTDVRLDVPERFGESTISHQLHYVVRLPEQVLLIEVVETPGRITQLGDSDEPWEVVRDADGRKVEIESPYARVDQKVAALRSLFGPGVDVGSSVVLGPDSTIADPQATPRPASLFESAEELGRRLVGRASQGGSSRTLAPWEKLQQTPGSAEANDNTFLGMRVNRPRVLRKARSWPRLPLRTRAALSLFWGGLAVVACIATVSFWQAVTI
jgi:hypothetical protein